MLEASFDTQRLLSFCKSLRTDGVQAVLDHRQLPHRGNTGEVIKLDWVDPANAESLRAWAIKTIHVSGPLAEAVMSELETEAAMLMHFEQSAPLLRIPRLHGVCPTGEKFGAAGIIMDWIDGTPLAWTTTVRDAQTKESLLQQVVDVCLHLWLYPVPPALLDKHCPTAQTTALDFLVLRIDRRLVREATNAPHFDLVDLLIHQVDLFRALLRHEDIWKPTLMHSDLTSNNILVDAKQRARSVFILSWQRILTHLVASLTGQAG